MNRLYLLLMLLFVGCNNEDYKPKSILLENRSYKENCGIEQKYIQDSVLINKMMNILKAEHEEINVEFNGSKWYIDIVIKDKFFNNSYNRPWFLYHREYGYLILFRKKLFKSKQLEKIIIKELQLGC